MGISNKYQRIPLDRIIVNRDERQRRKIDTKGLKESIEKRGVLQPILVSLQPDGQYLLHFGERRLTASRELGLTDIPARLAGDLSQIELQIIELEENIKRQDLEWQECVQTVCQIHILYLALDPGWTQGETAHELSLTQGTISMYLQVGARMAEERVRNAGTIREAVNLLDRRDQRAAGQALEDVLGAPDLMPGEVPGTGPAMGLADLAGQSPDDPLSIPPATPRAFLPAPAPVNLILPPDQAILQASFLEWAPQYRGLKFNLLHCDFPYGIEVFHGNRQFGGDDAAGYDDRKEVFFELLDCLCLHLDKLMSLSSHMVFWYSAKHRAQIQETFRAKAPSLEIMTHDLIWLKSDNAGVSAIVNRSPRHIYETAMLLSRGKRPLVQVKGDAYSAPTNKSLHPSTKPEPMLRHFFEMLVDENTLMLDPTCGSGASLRAAESLGAKHTLGLEIDSNYVLPARSALKTSRLLREGSRVLT